MAEIYLRHPEHGAKVASMEAEAIYDEKSGWVRYDPFTQSDDAADENSVAEAAPVNELAPLRRRGRRPAE